MNWRFQIEEYRVAGATSALIALGGAVLAAALAAAVPSTHSRAGEVNGPSSFAARFDAEVAMMPRDKPHSVATEWVGPDNEWPGSRAVPPVIEPNPEANDPASSPASPPPPMMAVPVVPVAEGDLCTQHGLHKVWVNVHRWRCRR